MRSVPTNVRGLPASLQAAVEERLASKLIVICHKHWPHGQREEVLSVRVFRKLTIASSSASVRSKRPTKRVFILLVDSGAGQQVVRSPTSSARQRGSVSRVLSKCT